MDCGAQHLHVPDAQGCLAPAGDLVYNDAPWLDAATAAVRTVHPNISNEARSFNLCLRH